MATGEDENSGGGPETEPTLSLDIVRDLQGLESYLQKGSSQEARIIAWRCAARVFPLIFEGMNSGNQRAFEDEMQHLVLAAFRAIFVSWAVSEFPDQRVSTFAGQAADVAEETMSRAGSRPPRTNAAVRAASMAARAGTLKSESLEFALKAVAASIECISQTGPSIIVEGAVDRLWAEIRLDIWAMAEETRNPQRAFWSGRHGRIFSDAENELRLVLKKWGDDWGVLYQWYEVVRDGRSPWDISAREHFVTLAREDAAFWQGRDEGAVVADIAQRLSKLETQLQDDLVDDEIDYLDRAPLAMILALRLNRIWNRLNPLPRPSEKYDSSRWSGRQPPDYDDVFEPGFVVHVDAPWGGGKTAFAEHVARILNPYRHGGPLPNWFKKLDFASWITEEYQRPWHIVHFNAWQHQHVDPPWWDFSETIRRQCEEAMRFEDNWHYETAVDTELLPGPQAPYEYKMGPIRLVNGIARLALRKVWELFTPDMWAYLALTIFGTGIALVLFLTGYDSLQAVFEPSPPKAPEPSFLSPLVAVETATPVAASAGPTFYDWILILVPVFGGIGTLTAVVVSIFKTLFSGTPAAAKAYSLGRGDPMNNFRRHFERTIASFQRPVLVIVDDLDRCPSKYVAELVRGMQTALQSRRIIYMVLGDKDWIEKAFEKHYAEMKEIARDSERSFGGLFIEKAIRFSFVLPEISVDHRAEYVRKILEMNTEEPSQEQVEEVQQFREEQIARILSSAFDGISNSVLQASKALELKNFSPSQKVALQKQFRFTQSASLAGSDAAHKATSHALIYMAEILPSNPRQIKRIVNAITLYNAVANIADPLEENWDIGSTNWQRLARWVILSDVLPQTWYSLSKRPELAEDILAGRWPFDASEGELNRVQAILDFKNRETGWGENKINKQVVEKMRSIVPPVSGKMLPLKPPEEKTSFPWPTC